MTADEARRRYLLVRTVADTVLCEVVLGTPLCQVRLQVYTDSHDAERDADELAEVLAAVIEDAKNPCGPARPRIT